MKISYDSQIFAWQRHGGISRYFYELATRISIMQGQKVKIFCPLHVNDYLGRENSGLLPRSIQIPVFPLSGRILRVINEQLSRFSVLNFCPDLIHETYYSTKPFFPSVKKRVITIHDMIHEKFPEHFSKFDPVRMEKASSAARADHIICVSESTKRDVIEILNVDPEKISVIHLASSLGVHLARGSGIKLDSRPFILYVGNRGGHKNFNGFLSAYASSIVKNSISIICFGGGGFSREELERARYLGVNSEHLMQISGDDHLLTDLYRAASLFIYPSKYEGFGIPLLEAMSFGCPVATSNVSSMPEVSSNAAVYFDPNDVGSICAGMEKVLQSNDLSKQFRLKGVERSALFSWDKCALQTLSIYEDLCG
jgi:glycosyltransferase involved in cell wall biosynthesis